MSLFKKRANYALAVVGTMCLLASVTHAQGVYDFTVHTPTSRLQGSLSTSMTSDGTLIGNYNAETNPTGTRTKPGLFGTFGATENLPVAAALGGQISGPLDARSSGVFGLSVDTEALSLEMTGLLTNLLTDGPVELPVTLSLQTETFRTRNPMFIYPGVPITLPIGNASLTAMSLRQVGGGLGTLIQVGPNEFDFIVTPLVELTLTATLMGNEFALPGTPTPIALGGRLTLSGETATVSAVQMIEQEFSQTLDQALPQTPFALPTLDPNSPANVLLDLVVRQISGSIDATWTLNANGRLVPAPGAWLLIAGAGLAASRRRRR